jgi:3-keto-5-aminohexanoate cleavage enzyme
MSKLPNIMVAPNGARRSAADHPALPTTIPQIVTDARDCFAAGAQAIHAHVRDSDGQHSLDAGLYAELLAELAVAVPEMVVQITTEAAGHYSPEEQRNLVQELCPAQVSIALREMIVGQSGTTLKQFYHWAIEAGISIQHILYTAQDVRMMEGYVARDVIPSGGLELMFVLGQYGGARDSRPSDLAAFLAERQDAIENAGWAVCAFGRHETVCLLEALRHGGKARIGFENNLLNSDGSLASSNAARVKELVQAIAVGETAKKEKADLSCQTSGRSPEPF